MEIISLNGSWKMKDCDSSEWIDAEVPGSVFCDLLRAKKIPDPYFRDNDDLVREEYATKNYEYTHEFEIPDSFLKNDRLFLRCLGLDTIADVYLNAVRIASVNDMHRTYEFNIKGTLKAGRNDLRVVFSSPLNFVRQKYAEDPNATFCSDRATPGAAYLRKGHSMFGWDSEPEIPDSGIWRNIELIGFSGARLDTVYIHQEHKKNRVAIKVEIPVECCTDEKLVASIKLLSPDGKIWTGEGGVAGGKAEISVEVENPLLWWPNGYGSQPLYTLETELKNGRMVIDTQKKIIGLRELYVRREPDKWGESFEFVCNGVPVFAKGADYIPLDKFLPRGELRLEQLFRDCVAVHNNCMRVWGGAVFPSDLFYDLADRYGIIIWEDLMFACSYYRYTDEFEENIIAETRDNVKRLRHHASLGLWCGNNENEWLLLLWKPDATAEDKRNYIRQYEIILAGVVKKNDPDRVYISSSPTSDGLFHDPNGLESGDAHCWTIWHNDRLPYTAYKKYPARFTSEFGLQSFPNIKTLYECTVPEDRNISSYIMDHRQRNGNGYGNAQIMLYVLQDMPYPKSFEMAVYASQIVQSEAVRFGSEAWRKERGRCMGAIYWQISDCWQAPTWSSIDYAGRWKALHYRSRHFFAPILLSVDAEGDELTLYVVSDKVEKKAGTVHWYLRDAESKIINEGKIQTAIAPLSSSLISSLDRRELLKNVNERDVYLDLQMEVDGDVINVNTYMFVKDKHFSFKEPGFDFSVRDAGKNLEITLVSSAFARYVYLDLAKDDCRFSDNFFDMATGKKKILVSKDSLSVPLGSEAFASQLRVNSVYDIG
jgi:beta-mannosidase